MTIFPKTIDLTNSEVRIDIGMDYCVVKNLGASNVYASSLPDLIPEKDGVYCIREGEKETIPLKLNDRGVYLMGQDKVTLWGRENDNDGTDNEAREIIINHAGDSSIHHSPESIAETVVQVLSNRNLLRNPNFGINQRGQSEYGGAGGYCVDGWFRNPEASVSITNRGIGLSFSGITNPSIYQKIDNFTQLLGKQLTFSAFIDGEVLSCTGTVPKALANAVVCFARIDKGTSAPSSSDPHIRVQCVKSMNAIICVLNNVAECSWVKLEIGDSATPFVTPDPTLELIKCKRYYQRAIGAIGVGAVLNSSSASTIIPISPMRAEPQISLNGNMLMYCLGHTDDSGIDVQISGSEYTTENSSILLSLDVPTEQSLAGTACIVQLSSGSFIEFSAEL